MKSGIGTGLDSGVIRIVTGIEFGIEYGIWNMDVRSLCDKDNGRTWNELNCSELV